MSQICSLRSWQSRRVEERFELGLRTPRGERAWRGWRSWPLSRGLASRWSPLSFELAQEIPRGRREQHVGGERAHVFAVAQHLLQISNADDLFHLLIGVVKDFVHQRGVDGIYGSGLIERARGFAAFDKADGLADAAAQIVIHHRAGLFAQARGRVRASLEVLARERADDEPARADRARERSC